MFKFSLAALAALLLVSGNNLLRAESPLEDAVPGAVTRHLDLQDGDDAEVQLAHGWPHRGFFRGRSFFYPRVYTFPRVYTYRPFYGSFYYQPYYYSYRPYSYWW